MADKKISDLTAVTSIAPGDLFEIENAGGNSRKVTSVNAIPILLIQEVVTSGSQASVTFSSISSSYRDLLIIVRGRGTNASTNVQARIQFNGDTGANYQFENTNWTSTVGSATQSTGQTFLQMASQLPGASATANYCGNASMRVFDYRGTTFYKSIFSEGGASLGTGASTQQVGLYGGIWSSTAAITSILVSLNAGNFVDNSVVSLYGCM